MSALFPSSFPPFPPSTPPLVSLNPPNPMASPSPEIKTRHPSMVESDRKRAVCRTTALKESQRLSYSVCPVTSAVLTTPGHPGSVQPAVRWPDVCACRPALSGGKAEPFRLSNGTVCRVTSPPFSVTRSLRAQPFQPSVQ